MDQLTNSLDTLHGTISNFQIGVESVDDSKSLNEAKDAINIITALEAKLMKLQLWKEKNESSGCIPSKFYHYSNYFRLQILKTC